MSEVLLEHNLFVPLQMGLDSDPARRLAAVVDEANKTGFQLKVAVIAEPTDLGPRSSLYRRPQKMADFLAADVSARDGVLVVMPNGFGYATGTASAEPFRRALAALSVPGRGAQEETAAAAVAVRRLAVAGGYVIAPTERGGGSETRDRIIIAAAAAAAAALIAGGMFYRRRRRTLQA